MKDRTNPCIYYVCAGADCGKGYKEVTLKRCKNCPKYRGRKTSRREKPAKLKRIESRIKYGGE